MQQFNDETTEKNSVGTMRRVLSKQQIQMLFHIHRSSAHLFNVISRSVFRLLLGYVQL